MSGYEQALTCGFAIALLVSLLCGNLRVAAWVMVCAVVYGLTEYYARNFVGVSFTVANEHGGIRVPFAPLIALFGDAAISLAVFFKGKYRWETSIVWRLFQISMGVNLYHLLALAHVPITLPVLDHGDYAAILEAINWLALLFLGGTAVTQRLGAADAFAVGRWSGVRRTLASLYRTRATIPFHRAG